MKNDYFNKFLEYENKNNLFDLDFEGFKIWEILRTYIFIEIEQIHNNLQPLFPQNVNFSKRKITMNSIKKSLHLFLVRKKEYIFLNNPRRVKQKDGKYYCIYTDILIDLLKSKHTVTTFEDPYWSLSKTSSISHFEPIKTDDICYLDFIEYMFNIKKHFYIKYSKKYRDLNKILTNLKKEIEKEFECSLTNIFKVAEDKILYLILNKKIYTRILKRIKPKAVFEFYDAFPSKVLINKVAKELNIPIVEIQHGIVTEENPIFLKYSDLHRRYDCLPNYVLSYGKKLLNTNHMPIDKQNIYYIGSLFLNKKLIEYRNAKPNKKNILFISQSNLGKYISDCASKVADLLKDDDNYRIIYKMHPYEIGNSYPNLAKPNIEVINNREKDLYYYHSISIAQVGIYSTGLYEGLIFGLPTFILNNDYGTKEIKGMLKSDNQIKYVDNAAEIVNELKNISATKKKNNTNYWQKVNEKEIITIIEKITNNN